MAAVVGRRAYPTQSSSIIRNIAPKLFLVDGDINSAAFLGLTQQLSGKNTMTEQFSWDVDTFLSLTDTVQTGIASGATVVAVSDGNNFIANQMWKVQRTGEIVYVSSVSGNNVTIVRSLTTTAAAAMLAGDILVRLAPAVGESSTRQSTQTTTPTRKSNYTQIFRYDISLSDRQIKREYDTDDEMPYQHMKAFKEAKMDINRAFLFGEQSRATIGGDDVTTTDGIIPVISTNSWAVGGTLYEYDFDEFLAEQGLRFGSSNKVAICSTAAMLAIDQMAKDRVQYESSNFEFGKAQVGVQIARYHARGGSIVMIEDRNLSEVDNGTMVIIDPTQIKTRTFTNNGRSGDLHMIMDTQNTDDIGNVATIYGDMGLEYGAEQHHAKITGITGGAMKRSTL